MSNMQKTHLLYQFNTFMLIWKKKVFIY